MSYSNSIKSLLDIQDPNIIFEEDCVKEGTFKDKTCTYISGNLTYNPTYCEKCGAENIDYNSSSTSFDKEPFLVRSASM